MKIAIVGGGNIGGAFAKAWTSGGLVDSQDLLIIERDETKRRALALSCGCQTTIDGGPALAEVGLLVMAVKPQESESACRESAAKLSPCATVLSVMAGIPVAKLQSYFGARDVVRAMPNTPAQIGVGMTVFFRTPGSKFDPAALLSSVGATLEVSDETLIDAATALSGSGPAYFFYLFEQLEAAGREIGFTSEQAKQLIIQTCRGAAALWDGKDVDPKALRAAVTSKGGTTEAAMRELGSGGIADAITGAVIAAFQRARELAQP